MQKKWQRARQLIRLCIGQFLALLPNDPLFNRWRLAWWQRQGYSFGAGCSIQSSVKFKGDIIMGNGCSLSNNVFLAASGGGRIVFGDYVMVGPNSVVVAFTHGTTPSRPMVLQKTIGKDIVVQDDVWIGANCTITPGVHIGRGSIIGAGAVVTSNIPAYSIAVGAPARVIGQRGAPMPSATVDSSDSIVDVTAAASQLSHQRGTFAEGDKDD